MIGQWSIKDASGEKSRTVEISQMDL